MKEERFRSYGDLPLTLTVPEVGEVLGISRAKAYDLARSEGFPSMRIGTRIHIYPAERTNAMICQLSTLLFGFLIKNGCNFQAYVTLLEQQSAPWRKLFSALSLDMASPKYYSVC